jgi:stage V sporulation protein B
MRKKLTPQTTKRGLLMNILYGLGSGIVSKVGALFFTVLIARSFLPDEFGVYSLALTIILTLWIITDMGLTSTITRFTAESLGYNDMLEARSRFWYLAGLKILFSLFFAGLLFLFSSYAALFFNEPRLTPLLQIGSIYLIMHSLYTTTTAFFLAVQKVKYSMIIEGIFQISRVALLGLALLYYKSLLSIFVVLTISVAISLLSSSFILFHKYRDNILGEHAPIERKRMLTYSFYLALSSFTLFIFTDIDKLVLGYFLPSVFIGYYNAIFTVISAVLGFLSFTSILLPVFTQLKGDAFLRSFQKVFHYISIITFPAAIGLAFVIVPLLKIVYGFSYVPDEYSLIITLSAVLLSLLIIETNLSGLYKIVLNSQERPKIPAYTTLFASLFNLVLNIIFISYLIKIDLSYGLLGAATATFITRYSALFVLVYAAYYRAQVYPKLSSILYPLFASLIMVIFLSLYSFFIPLTPLLGAVMIILGATLYFITLYIAGGIDIQEVRTIIASRK